MKSKVICCAGMVFLCSGLAFAEVPWSDVPRALSANATQESEERGSLTGPKETAQRDLDRGFNGLVEGRETEDVLWDMGKMVVALAAVCGLLYVFLKYGLQRIAQPKGAQRFEIIEKFGLEPKRVLYIMEIEGRRMLLGSGESGIRFLTHLDEATGSSRPGVTAVLKDAEPTSSFLQVLQRKLDRPTLERVGEEIPATAGQPRGDVS